MGSDNETSSRRPRRTNRDPVEEDRHQEPRREEDRYQRQEPRREEDRSYRRREPREDDRRQEPRREEDRGYRRREPRRRHDWAPYYPQYPPTTVTGSTVPYNMPYNNTPYHNAPYHSMTHQGMVHQHGGAPREQHRREPRRRNFTYSDGQTFTLDPDVRVTVRKWVPEEGSDATEERVVDIRRVVTKEHGQFLTKKGVVLSLEQYHALRDMIGEIDAALEQL